MKHLIIIGAFALLLKKSTGQILTDNHPINYYFEKIEFANLPDPEINKKGVIFYTSDVKYLNSFIINKLYTSITQCAPEIYKYKFKKDRYRYTNYFYSLAGITFGNDEIKTLTDTSALYIMADRNKRVWSWRKFSIVLRKLSTDTIFSATIYSTDSLDTTHMIKGTRFLTYNPPTLIVLRNGNPFISKQVSTDNWPLRTLKTTL